ncbi:GntR family transcriptional regulator [Streptomyces filamentosus]|uniref:GntR family transcriptional regulator n=1 Tax=Streptomyces filamentosus TaxID=67294 RepID=A0A919EQ04_STRFL|nr:GntR family transcriptional regulator [Streptomyces filamentosus]GHG15226.1 GntR family transcriptional regulator [Streptomyces filamentosus]
MTRDLSHLPPYRRIAEQIIERIRTGALQPGQATPSVDQIMRTEKVSRATAARVISVLRDEGWANAIPGVGTIVKERQPLTQGASRIGMVRGGGSGLLDGETVEFVEARTEPASQEVADALGVEVGADVVLRRRRYIDGAGVSVVSTTWVTSALAERLPAFTQPEKLPKMTMGYIEDQTGRRATQQRETHSVDSVPEDISAQLDAEAGERVLKVTNRYVDQDGEPTEYAVDWHAPRRSWVDERPVE